MDGTDAAIVEARGHAASHTLCRYRQGTQRTRRGAKTGQSRASEPCLGLMAAAPAHDPSPIPSAPFDDLDLDRDDGEEEWERRVMALAAARVAAARSRLERLGIIDAEGSLVSRELPADMLPDSDTTLETG